MSRSTAADIRTHVKNVLSISLDDHLDIRNDSSFSDYALLGPVVVLYRMAEMLGQKIRTFDMFSLRHRSHDSGTETDFGIAPGQFDPIHQAHVVADLLRIRNILRPDLQMFRIGFYFDSFDDKEAEEANTFERFQKTYRGRQTESLHLGVIYNWKSPEYKGSRVSSFRFGIWGADYGHHMRSTRWERRLLSWPIGLLGGRHLEISQQALADFQRLDSNPPGDLREDVPNSGFCGAERGFLENSGLFPVSPAHWGSPGFSFVR